MENPECKKDEEVRIIRFLDRDTAVKFIVDSMLDPAKKITPDMYTEIRYVTKKR